jgi:hypothetical protein
MSNDNRIPPESAVASARLLHPEQLVSAYADATPDADRRLFLRGVLRVLQYVAGKTHAALVAVTAAMAKEGRP